MDPELIAAGRHRYVSLTTFRRSGVGVATAVWIAPVDDALIVVTGAASGKAKRLRRDPRVELRACTSRGRVLPGAAVAHGRAELVSDAQEQDRLLAGHRRKYGLQFRAFGVARAVQRLLARGAAPEEVVIRITDA